MKELENARKEQEKILWSEVGTKQDYEREIGSVPLGEFVRSVIGLDMNAAKAAFADYLDSTEHDSRQIYFVNQIVEYIVHNGMIICLLSSDLPTLFSIAKCQGYGKCYGLFCRDDLDNYTVRSYNNKR